MKKEHLIKLPTTYAAPHHLADTSDYTNPTQVPLLGRKTKLIYQIWHCFSEGSPVNDKWKRLISLSGIVCCSIVTLLENCQENTALGNEKLGEGSQGETDAVTELLHEVDGWMSEWVNDSIIIASWFSGKLRDGKADVSPLASSQEKYYATASRVPSGRLISGN